MAKLNELITLGVIGMSPGNGHPYSWSAIFNGYDPTEMEDCPFPAIPAYLAERNFPDDQLMSGRVTHVWTGERASAEHISSACRIATVVDERDELIGAVDGVLLARDDADRHVEMALPFLNAGMPVYVDKPFALTRVDANAMLQAEQFDGQIFTGSALLYANELELGARHRESIGTLQRIEAVTPKSWATYAPHIVEPVLAMTQDKGNAEVKSATRDGPATTVQIAWKDGAEAVLRASGAEDTAIKFQIWGDSGSVTLEFRDSFSCFRAALADFCEGGLERTRRFDKKLILNSVDVIEAGMSGSSV